MNTLSVVTQAILLSAVRGAAATAVLLRRRAGKHTNGCNKQASYDKM